jgi:WD40 repeat protein
MDPRVITRLVGHRGGVMAIAYSPVDGNALASGGEMGEVFIWDVAKGNRRVLKDIHRSGQYGAEVWAVAWAADGQTLASGDGEGVTAVWDVVTGKARAVLCGFLGHSDPQDAAVFSLAFMPSEPNALLTGTADGVLTVWDVTTARAMRRLRPSAGVGAVVRIAVAPADSTAPGALAACALESLRGVALWRGGSAELAADADAGEGGARKMEVVGAAWEPGALVEGAAHGEAAAGLAGGAYCVAFDRSATRLAIGTGRRWAHCVLVASLAGGACERTHTLEGHTDIVRDVSVRGL